MANPETNEHTNNRYKWCLVLGIILVGTLLPLFLYWIIYGQTEMVSPIHAKELLSEPNSKAVLVDIRSRDEYDAGHIDGALHWPNQDILSLDTKTNTPEQYQDKILLLICKGGVFSSIAAKHLKSIGNHGVLSVRGGIQEWIASVSRPEGGAYDKFRTVSGTIREFPFRQSPFHEQMIAVANGFAIKPTYTLLSLILAILLWRKLKPDLIALRWSMIFFFLGENCCAINYLVFSDRSYFFEYLHSIGMLISFGFATYAIFEGMDSRILMLSDPNKICAAINLCQRCIKYDAVPCGLRRTFFLIIPALIIVASMPLSADWNLNSYNTVILGEFYNYTHRVIYQQFETTLCPIISMILLTISLLILGFKKTNSMPLAKIFFAAGIGPLGFGMFRTILSEMYSQNMVWLNFWEESTELLFILAVCVVLWIFRQSIFKHSTTGSL